MKKLLPLVCLGIAISTMATATTISFADGETPEAGDGFQNNATFRVWNIPGIGIVEVRAFRYNGSTFTAAGTTQFGASNIGLGVCTDTLADPCFFNEWQIDNGSFSGLLPGASDFVLFTFSVPVDIASVVIRQTTFFADSDVAYYSQAAAAIAPSTSWGLTPDGGPFMGPGDSRTIDINATNVQTLLFGTPSGSDDYWKLGSMDITSSSTQTPEPGSLVLIGAGLVGVGALRHWRKR
jgi:hypothetical protein